MPTLLLVLILIVLFAAFFPTCTLVLGIGGVFEGCRLLTDSEAAIGLILVLYVVAHVGAARGWW